MYFIIYNIYFKNNNNNNDNNNNNVYKGVLILTSTL